MIYACEDCGFLFRRVSEVRECPSCEGGKIRPASEEESRVLQNYLALQSNIKKGLTQT